MLGRRMTQEAGREEGYIFLEMAEKKTMTADNSIIHGDCYTTRAGGMPGTGAVPHPPNERINSHVCAQDRG